MADVAIARCERYENAEAALLEALAPFGSLDWVRPGMKVALKVNLVSGGKPDSAVVPHPKFVSALCRLLVARGAEVVVGDSPGGLYTAPFVGHVYSASGMTAVEEVGARLNHDFSQRAVSFPEGKILRSFQYTAWLDGADAIIDVCKLKTHGMLYVYLLSCAVKNLFGVIPGTLKPEYHFRYPNPDDFAAMLVDLADFVRPRLSICDAVVAMEGNGPTAGTPRNVGAVLAAQSPHALDLAAAHIIGLRAQDVPTLAAAHRRGYIPEDAQALSIAGELFAVPRFQSGGGAQFAGIHPSHPRPPRSAGGQGHAPLDARPPGPGRARMRGLRPVRARLSRPRHPYAREASAHRPAQVHLLLLLSGILSPGGDEGAANVRRPRAGWKKHGKAMKITRR